MDDWDDLDIGNDMDLKKTISYSQQTSKPTSKFDQYQLAAITADIHQPLIITAGTPITDLPVGPGSGKTRTILERINHILTLDTNPSSKVLALTFSRRASDDMKKGLSENIKKRCVTQTIHSFCFSVLNKHKGSLGMTSLTVLHDKDARKILKGIMTKQNQQKLDPYELKNTWTYISKQKSSLIPPMNHGDEIYRAYNDHLKRTDCLGTVDLFHLRSLGLHGKDH
jgi:superfamily I DNA/RNA helicase